MRKTTTVIFSMLALVMMLTGAGAEIASREYVDQMDDGIYETIFTVQGDVQDANDKIEQSLGLSQSIPEAIVMTDENGNVKLGTHDVIEDKHISEVAGIQMGKINFPTPGPECSTKGCMLMFYDDAYVWEVVARENDETIAKTGAVDAEATFTSSPYQSFEDAAAPGGGFVCQTNSDCVNAGLGTDCSGGVCISMK